MRGNHKLVGEIWQQLRGAMALPALVTAGVWVLGSIGISEGGMGLGASWSATLLGLVGGVALSRGPEGAPQHLLVGPNQRTTLLGIGLTILTVAMGVMTALSLGAAYVFHGSATFGTPVMAAGLLSAGAGIALGTVASARSEGLGLSILALVSWTALPPVIAAQILGVHFTSLMGTPLSFLSPIAALGVATWAWTRYSPVATRRRLGTVLALSLGCQVAIGLALATTNTIA